MARDASGLTMAVLSDPIEEVLPTTHSNLLIIIKQGGALVSEYPKGNHPFETNFVARKIKGSNLAEQGIIDLLTEDVTDEAVLLLQSEHEVGGFNQTMTMLQITGKIRYLGANQWSLT